MLTVLNKTESKIVVNRSKFLGFVFCCSSLEERESILNNFKKEFYSATHICFAQAFWDGKAVSYISSDDREPSGTAGVQILNSIKENNLINVLCIVVRYFGGVKLGAQNLSKAYKQCADEAIRITQKKEVELKTKCVINCDYNIFNKLCKILQNIKNDANFFNDKITIETMLSNDEIEKVKSIVPNIDILDNKLFC